MSERAMLTGTAARMVALLLIALIAVGASIASGERSTVADAPEDRSGNVVEVVTTDATETHESADPRSDVVAALDEGEHLFVLSARRGGDRAMWYEVAREDGVSLGWLPATSVEVLTLTMGADPVNVPEPQADPDAEPPGAASPEAEWPDAGTP